jgi:hypothetical protein
MQPIGGTVEKRRRAAAIAAAVIGKPQRIC